MTRRLLHWIEHNWFAICVHIAQMHLLQKLEIIALTSGSRSLYRRIRTCLARQGGLHDRRLHRSLQPSNCWLVSSQQHRTHNRNNLLHHGPNLIPHKPQSLYQRTFNTTPRNTCVCIGLTHHISRPCIEPSLSNVCWIYCFPKNINIHRVTICFSL